MTHKQLILSILRSGRNFTTAQLAGLIRGTEVSVRNRVAELREEGHAIYTNQTKNGKVAYRLGKPSRQMVAAAFAVAGAEVFSRA